MLEIKKATIEFEPCPEHHVLLATEIIEFQRKEKQDTIIQLQGKEQSLLIRQIKVNGIQTSWNWLKTRSGVYFQSQETEQLDASLNLHGNHDIDSYDLFRNEKLKLQQDGELEIQLDLSATSFIVEIKYEIKSFEYGIQWTAHNNNDFLIYSTSDLHGALHWMFCIDRFAYRYDVEITLSPKISNQYELISSSDKQNDNSFEARECGFVLSTVGGLTNYFKEPMPEIISNTKLKLPQNFETQSYDPILRVFYQESKSKCLPPRQQQPRACIENLLKTVQFSRLFWHLESYLDMDVPFKEVKIVFLQDSAPFLRFNKVKPMLFGNLLIFPISCLFHTAMIEEVFSTTSMVISTAISSWVSCFAFSALSLESVDDVWIYESLVSWLSNLYLEQVFGRLFVEAEHIKRVEQLLGLRKRKHCIDVVMKQLSHIIGRDAMHTFFKELFALGKRGCVISSLHYKQLLQSTTSVPEPFLMYFTNDQQEEEKWKRFNVSYYFDARKKLIIVDISRQELETSTQPNFQDGADEEIAKRKRKPKRNNNQNDDALLNPPVQTEIRCKIHEVSRSVDHRLFLNENSNNISSKKRKSNRFILPCHSSVLRNRKRKYLELNELRDLSVEKLLCRNNETPMCYIRFDSFNTWFGIPTIKTSMMMLLQQLIGEKTFKGQFEAITNVGLLLRTFSSSCKAKSGYPKTVRLQTFNTHHFEESENSSESDLSTADDEESLGLSSDSEKTKQPRPIFHETKGREFDDIEMCEQAFKHVLNNAETFQWQIREQVIYVLAEFSSHYESLERVLFQYFNNLYVTKGTKLLRSNYFENVSDYFLKCSMIRALSLVRNGRGNETPENILQFLWFLDEQSNNNGNPFDDHHYRATLMEAFGNICLVPLSQLYHQWCSKITARLEHVYHFESFLISSSSRGNHANSAPNSDLCQVSALNSLCQWCYNHPQEVQLKKLSIDLFDSLSASMKSVNGHHNYRFQIVVWKWCLVFSEKNENDTLRLMSILEQFDSEHRESLGALFVQLWREGYEKQHLNVSLRRNKTPINEEFMNRLWNVLCNQKQCYSGFAYELQQLYYFIWSGENFYPFLSKPKAQLIAGLKSEFY
jgi:hypothetical protein